LGFLKRSAVLRGPARFAVVALALILVLFLYVFPTRSYLAQRRQIGAAQQDLNVLRAQNNQLTQEAARLGTDAEVERIARQEYHWVRPGEQAYVVTPAPSTTTTTAP
jgi:cell division protein FtsB